jgi:DNA helicase HerA-like ATPase
MLLAGVINADLASVLVFDMHNEYGMWSTDEETKKKAPALKEMFGQKVLIFSVDPDSSRRRSVKPDYEVQIAVSDIEVDDLVLLRRELNLSDAQVRDMDTLAERWGDDWLPRLIREADTMEDSDVPGVHLQSVKALARNLQRVLRLPFVKEQVTDHSAKRMLDALLAHRHVVIEFGGHTNFLSYMLVSSVVTRNIHRRWKEEKEKSQGSSGGPPQLVITLEEAHKFLSAEASNQTIFGTIAREMRKYNVTLLVVDQRPSGIDEEIRSQLGTRVIGSLDDERDQSSVLEGVPDAKSLGVLIKNLESKKQVLLSGYALPMPIVVETRDYYAFAKAMRRAGDAKAGPDVDLWQR